jgi:phosphoglycolate phosphatase
MYKLVIFDFDGTLADTAQGIRIALNEVLRENNLPPISLADSKKMIGGGVRHLVNKLKEHGYPTLPNVDELAERFHHHYHLHFDKDSELYPDVIETLKKIKCKVAILSNKPEQYLIPLLPDLKLDQFAWIKVIGGDTYSTKKPDAYVFEQVIAASGLSKSEILMVGDAEPDINGAHNSGIDSCGVTYGYTPSDELKELKPTHTIDHFKDLLKLL